MVQRFGAGITFIRTRPIILGTISLDLFAVLLGGVVALLPIYAQEVLHVGPAGLGALRSAMAVGEVGMGLALSMRPIQRHVGRTMFAAVAVFGAANLVFALSHWFWLSCLMLALAGSSRPSMVIMAGLAISTVSGAALAMVLNFAPNPFAMQELVFWLLGSVSERGLDHLRILLPALLIGSLLILRQRPLLYGLSLGEQAAQSLGLNVKRGSRLIVLGAAVLVGSAVAVAGAIGFVGLIVPHLVRPLVNHRPDRLLIPSMLAGATLVLCADLVVRLLPPGRELKLGVLTSLIGAPLFIWLVWRERQKWS